MDVLLVLGPGLVADRDLLMSLAGTSASALGVGLRVAHTTSAAETAAALAGHDGPAVAVPADPALMSSTPESVIWYDLRVAASVLGPRHLHGRGVWGLDWAIRHAVYRLRHPATQIFYGPHADQWADERGGDLPGQPASEDGGLGRLASEDGGLGRLASEDGGLGRLASEDGGLGWSATGRGGPVPPPPRNWEGSSRASGSDNFDGLSPVGVLIHGGFWRSIWAADLMDALAIDLTARGWVSWNLEYRRPDRHGWAATTADVAAGVAAARERHPGAPIVVFGHSAGGQLALRLAADDPSLALAVSLAGVLDLGEGQRRFLGEGAITTALGGSPDDVPEVYAAGDPMRRLPLASPALLVQGSDDGLDLVDINRRFAAASGIPLIEQAGDHFDIITPGSPIWEATMAEVGRTISRS